MLFKNKNKKTEQEEEFQSMDNLGEENETPVKESDWDIDPDEDPGDWDIDPDEDPGDWNDESAEDHSEEAAGPIDEEPAEDHSEEMAEPIEEESAEDHSEEMSEPDELPAEETEDSEPVTEDESADDNAEVEDNAEADEPSEAEDNTEADEPSEAEDNAEVDEIAEAEDNAEVDETAEAEAEDNAEVDETAEAEDEMDGDDLNDITENDGYYGENGDLVEPESVVPDEEPVKTAPEMDDDDDFYDDEEEGPKEKPNIFKYIVIAIGIIGLAIGAVMLLRTRLLQMQLDMGKQYLEAEDYDAATDTFNQALKIFHNSGDAYLGLAQASIGRGELTEAIKILEEGVEVTRSSNLEKSRENIIDQVFATYVLNEYMINILPGEFEQLEVSNRSEDLGFTVEWSSDNPSVGTVDENGLVTAVRNGTATIIATVGNEDWGYRDITASLVVGVIVTYLEEAGCDYVQDASALTAPCFVYQLDKDGYRIYDGTLEIEQGMATYSLTQCRASDPDANGMVDYEIVYTITVPTKFGILADSREAKYAWYYNWMAENMLLCDDYTGLIFGVKDLYGSDELIYDSTVEWNGAEYHISGTFEEEWVNNEEWAITYSPLTLTTWAEAPVIGTVSLHITVPKEYQGLVLALDKKGITDYTDPVVDTEEEVEDYDSSKAYEDSYFFDPQEDGTVRSPDDFYIVKLSDFTEYKE
ncbi:MAG: Ig-like domain-containing protein [Lachnospiraceae bacterium]|nr:Ig-like domain-containing protein [Lachnospiraceae bacterium]